MNKLSVFLLFGLIASAYGRVIITNVNVDRQRAWIASAKYLPRNVPDGKENNLLAAVFGNRLPGVGSSPPFVSVTFARGTGSLGDESNPFEGAVTGLIWAYSRLGEYCEINGVPGYQPNGDVLLKNYTYADATWNDIEAGETNGVYWASLTESSGTFVYTCRVSTSDRVDGGIEVGPYSLKCDVIVNATNFWTNNPQGCEDSNRYIGLLAFLGAGRVSVGANDGVDGAGQASIDMDDRQAFFKWKTTVENGETGVSYNVSARFEDITETISNLPSQVKTVRKAVFSFLSPKSETNVFVWDPEMGVDQTFADNGSPSTTIMYALTVALAVVLLML